MDIKNPEEKVPEAPKQASYQEQLNTIMGKIQNREPFQYDFNGDALYNQYKDRYIQQGNLAMQDTMGQAAALTGGYGNSYAQSVGQQTYQGYMQGLNDRIPDLYQMALDQYMREGNALMDQYGMLNEQAQFDWQKEQAQKEWDWRQMVWDYEHPQEVAGSGGGGGGGGSGGGGSGSGGGRKPPKKTLSVEEQYQLFEKNGASQSELDKYLREEIANGRVNNREATEIRDKRY